MDEHDWLAERFESHRADLRSVAYQMLGSLAEAEDAVQEAWLRLSARDPRDAENLGGWLTTVVTRIGLDMLHDMFAVPFDEIAGHSPAAARQLASRARRRVHLRPRHDRRD